METYKCVNESGTSILTSITEERTFKMSRFAVVVLCAMAFLVQAVLSQQCGCSCGSSGISLGGISLKSSGISGGSISSKSYSSSGSYGGAGTGRVGVIGDIDACGNTCVEGSCPCSARSASADACPRADPCPSADSADAVAKTNSH
ncbi:chorion class A protein L12-like [Leguminivora glycinivorella]|uniref:chorion class A protein L12-like n=1 Tax=Leguminivora glycinivorella TaxID=1035111 RepID=UPI00200F0C41|nr:chorion class A protein L12-like [Leguminivora glycinivorella]